MSKKIESDFGKGFVYSLMLFAKHWGLAQGYLKTWREMRKKNPDLFSDEDALELFFSGASDHLYELEIPYQDDILFWSYLAGFIDGEGCIGLYKHNQKNSEYLIPELSIVQKDVEVLNFLKEKLDGDIQITKDGIGHYRIPVSKIRNVLIQIYPFLKVKKKQAALLLEYFEIKVNRFKLVYRPKIKGQYVPGVIVSKIPKKELEIMKKLKLIKKDTTIKTKLWEDCSWYRIGKLTKEIQSKSLYWGHGFKKKPTDKQFQEIFEKFEKVARLIDKELGVKTIKAKWN